MHGASLLGHGRFWVVGPTHAFFFSSRRYRREAWKGIGVGGIIKTMSHLSYELLILKIIAIVKRYSPSSNVSYINVRTSLHLVDVLYVDFPLCPVGVSSVDNALAVNV